MFLRLPLLLCFLCALLINQSNGYKDPGQADTPYNELPCIVIGGTCTAAGTDCQTGRHITVTGLCPKQEEQGVECCHSVSKKVDTCRSHGGECMDLSFRCPENLTYRKAVDCSENQKCCILVK